MGSGMSAAGNFLSSDQRNDIIVPGCIPRCSHYTNLYGLSVGPIVVLHGERHNGQRKYMLRLLRHFSVSYYTQHEKLGGNVVMWKASVD